MTGLWTDSKENKFIEESGMMNVSLLFDNTLVTPPLSDSILDGVTRDSLLKRQVILVIKQRKDKYQQMNKNCLSK